DSDAAHHLTHHVVQAGRLCHLRFCDSCERSGAERNEDEREAHSLPELRPEDVPETDVGRENRETPETVRTDDESRPDQDARTKFVVESPRDRHEQRHGQAARHERDSGLRRIEPDQILQKERQQKETSIECQPQHATDRRRGSEGDVAEYSQIDSWPVRFHLAPDEQHQANRSDRSEAQDEPGLEPLVALALFQHELQRAQSRDEQSESQEIDLSLFANEIWRILNEARDEDEIENPDREIDVEDPRPRVIIREPAAERGSERRREHDAESVHAHRYSL